MFAEKPIVVAWRLLFAGLTIAAIVTQLVISGDRPGFSAGNFFSYFTILGNSFAAAMLLYGALRPGARSLTYDRLRTASVMFMLIVGIVFALLLADIPRGADSTLPWVNNVLHHIMPVVVLLDWVLVPPRNRLAIGDVIKPLGVLVVYLVYTLIRGAIVDWYPYPFLDATKHGVLGVLAGSIPLGLGAFVVGWAVIAAGNALRIRRDLPDEWHHYRAL
jgi:hypothetical protein